MRERERLTISNRARCLAVFTHQLAILLQAGVPLLAALEALEKQGETSTWRAILTDLASTIASGSPFSKALSRYPRVFSKVYVGQIQTGEATGLLTNVLQRLATSLEKEAHLGSRVTSALSYPAFVLAVAALLTFVIFQTVLPDMMQTLKGLAVPLPLITRVLVWLTEALRNPSLWATAVGAGLWVYLSAKNKLSTLEGRAGAFQLLLRLPGIGPLLRCSSLTRYCWVMHSLLESGLSLDGSLRMAAVASGSPQLELDADWACESIVNGESLSKYFRGKNHIYPSIMAQMVAVAEESSSPSRSFADLGSWFAMDTEHHLNTLTASLEPLMLGVLSVLVGTIVIAIFLPLYASLDAF